MVRFGRAFESFLALEPFFGCICLQSLPPVMRLAVSTVPAGKSMFKGLFLLDLRTQDLERRGLERSSVMAVFAKYSHGFFVPTAYSLWLVVPETWTRSPLHGNGCSTSLALRVQGPK